MKKSNWQEKLNEKLYLISALISIALIFSITLFIFIKGVPAIKEIGIKNFILGTNWKPGDGQYGILPMIVGSIYVTIGACLVGVPIGLFTAIYLSEMANKKTADFLRKVVELLAGIPSVVFGFFGLVSIVPLIDKFFGGGGNSLFASSIILGIMILPTIISISEASIRSVPKEYKEGSLALGSTHIDSIFKVMLPSAKSGILASIVLALGRAIGETMAVILVSGNTPLIPHSIFDRVRTLTSNIAIEMGYAYGLHQDALFATGVILFVFIMIINGLFLVFNRKAGELND
ncbi:phosphate ABC transporter permease subunit PstC [Anaerosalibacter bizertensis]|uniref:Phosphate transport system permease protein n=1 Tax=Anaerosalibacter bizertensis TaxID=932217 RepID=A0A9Q4ABC1_9FIRM|nr:phosphate ABC transporter permease subunit PstC [Anaerosalibacter bizertensis]MBU5292705.1 phosphate ABC transporter permease subunit PstC [Anaerosalibacter bizertensis]MCG4564496.1 phosphate ABC transporter permease subunit PstC [Anaerosalibacter bizertensis]MCG4581386.1 phosphate ABC transporter permease subunit PstC [Anaerosalibacter bizertensis]HHV26835.1 phosphate ABC transporter permease subunit PstC [Tissierellia bacterium]